MNRFLPGTAFLLSCWLCAPHLRAESPEVETARQHGARGRVTLRVIDSTGKPVDRAQLNLALFPSDSYANADVREGQTDTNGCFDIEGTTVEDMTYTISKTDYYKTTGKYWFYRRGENCVQNGRWRPWNPTNAVVLKEHRKPIAMYAKNVDVCIPVCDTPVGFDLAVGDWVTPHGKGSRRDIFFTYRSDIKDVWTGRKELIIACTNKLEGFCRAQKDVWSGFGSEYDAPTDGYQPTVNLILAATKDRVLKSERISESEYLTFRVRVVLDDKAKIISALYGKICGPVEYGAGWKLDRLRFTYYLNPTDNDRNVEFDPRRNLLVNPGSMRVYMP